MTSLHHDDSIEIIATSSTSASAAYVVPHPAAVSATSLLPTASVTPDHVSTPSADARSSHVIDIGMTLVSAATGVVHPVGFAGPTAPLTGASSGGGSSRYFRRKLTVPLPAKQSVKEKRIKKAVMAIASLMILASMLLVGASLSMSQHIDEMVRQMNGFLTTTTSRPYALQLNPSNVTVSSDVIR